MRQRPNFKGLGSPVTGYVESFGYGQGHFKLRAAAMDAPTGAQKCMVHEYTTLTTRIRAVWQGIRQLDDLPLLSSSWWWALPDGQPGSDGPSDTGHGPKVRTSESPAISALHRTTTCALASSSCWITQNTPINSHYSFSLLLAMIWVFSKDVHRPFAIGSSHLEATGLPLPLIRVTFDANLSCVGVTGPAFRLVATGYGSWCLVHHLILCHLGQSTAKKLACGSIDIVEIFWLGWH
eukprot:g61776.t1